MRIGDIQTESEIFTRGIYFIFYNFTNFYHFSYYFIFYSFQENRALRQASVHIQAKAEQEEEFISNTLLKKVNKYASKIQDYCIYFSIGSSITRILLLQIQALKKEKENLALNYEQEEECLTNDLSRKLNQVSFFS